MFRQNPHAASLPSLSWQPRSAKPAAAPGRGPVRAVEALAQEVPAGEVEVAREGDGVVLVLGDDACAAGSQLVEHHGGVDCVGTLLRVERIALGFTSSKRTAHSLNARIG